MTWHCDVCSRTWTEEPSVCADLNGTHACQAREVTASTPSIRVILADRGKTHGDFGDNATVALQIRDVMRSMKPHWSNLSAEQRLALEEIALKIARICSGGNWEAEHWRDIQGYAKLAEEACNSRNAAQSTVITTIKTGPMVAEKE